MTDKRESFANMTAAFLSGSNWRKIEKAANKKQKYLDKLKQQGDM